MRRDAERMRSLLAGQDHKHDPSIPNKRSQQSCRFCFGVAAADVHLCHWYKILEQTTRARNPSFASNVCPSPTATNNHTCHPFFVVFNAPVRHELVFLLGAGRRRRRRRTWWWFYRCRSPRPGWGQAVRALAAAEQEVLEQAVRGAALQRYRHS